MLKTISDVECVNVSDQDQEVDIGHSRQTFDLSQKVSREAASATRWRDAEVNDPEDPNDLPPRPDNTVINTCLADEGLAFKRQVAEVR